MNRSNEQRRLSQEEIARRLWRICNMALAAAERADEAEQAGQDTNQETTVTTDIKISTSDGSSLVLFSLTWC